MKQATTIIMSRSDLEKSISKDIMDITLADFPEYTDDIKENDITLFIDIDGKTKILSNRYGDRGDGIFKKMVSEIKTILATL